MLSHCSFIISFSAISSSITFRENEDGAAAANQLSVFPCGGCGLGCVTSAEPVDCGLGAACHAVPTRAGLRETIFLVTTLSRHTWAEPPPGVLA